MTQALNIKDLTIHYQTEGGAVQALRHVDLAVPDNKVVGIVGESGCGKSTLISSIINLMAENAEVKGGEVMFGEEDVLKMSKRRLRKLRGYDIAMVFQDPMTTFNPGADHRTAADRFPASVQEAQPRGKACQDCGDVRPGRHPRS